MLTTIGKILVYVTLVISLVGLGVSLWAVADKTDYKVVISQLDTEINTANTARKNEVEQLGNLINKINARDTKIARGPDEIVSRKDISIAEALAESDAIEKQLKDIVGLQQLDEQKRLSIINDLQANRDALRQAKELGNNLRLVMYPDEARVREGERSFRDQIASLQVAKEEVERRTAAMQPDLYNAAIRLQNLQQRLKGLQERAKELGIN